MKRKNVYVVPHSHWDREWYFTIEDSNVLLSQNILYLMDVLENDCNFKSYTFDGQLSIVEEFLKIHPEESERLKKLIKDKRIFVGPWYTQTDSLLVNKESIIRNLLYGTRIGNEFGNCMNVGYLPDIFGQNSYLPSIFNGFDIKYSVLQRGIYTDQFKDNLNFLWGSKDSNYVRSNNIFLGYGPGKFLSHDDEYLNEKLIPMLSKLESLNKDTDNLLLPAGGDQVLVRKEFPVIIENLNKKQDKYNFILSNYEEFMEDTFKKDFKNEINGELIACEKSRIHSTIKSQRVDIKMLNYSVENKILYVLEPLSVILKSLGGRYPKAWIDMMWKLLFDVHSHDSIGGCNSDDTNSDIIVRLKKVERICDGLINITKKQITESVKENLHKENIILLFNTLGSNKKTPMEAIIFTSKEDFDLTSLNGEKAEFDIVSSEYLSGGKKVIVTAEGEKEIELDGYYKSKVLIKDIEIPSVGYSVLCIEEGKKILEDRKLKECSNNFIENNTYKIEILNNEISLLNKVTNEKIQKLFYFEDTCDAGDSYDYSPLEGDKEIISWNFDVTKTCKSSLIESISLTHKIKLAKDLDERKQNIKSIELDINTTLELRDGEEFVRVKNTILNNAKDHRVRVIFNTAVNSKMSFADQAFSTIERENFNQRLNSWRENKYAEAPLGIYALENFAGIKDKENTFAILTKGIKEYEILENSKFALTLYRSVGVLGKDDLLIRPGRASGINNKVVYTKNAQLLCTMEFEYSVYFGKTVDNNVHLFKTMDTYIKKYDSYQNQNLNLFEERLERFEIPKTLVNSNNNYSLFNIENENVFISTLKESYEKDGIILRLFNPGDKDENVKIKSDYIKSIKITNLYEKELTKCNDEIIIPKNGYTTLKLIFNF